MNMDTISQHINGATIGELEQIAALAQAELEKRRRKRRDEAIAEIRRIAGAEHIPVSFTAKVRPPKGEKMRVYRSGCRYQHPADKAMVWTGKGQKPNWLRELEAQGGKAVELP
jgi:DNA-binding protein H-NS